MNKKKKAPFLGAATALITPFLGGKIDYKALGALIDYQIDGGINALVVAGTTGEAPTLSYSELKELFGFSVKHAKGRAVIIAGCGSNATDRSVELALTATECGCDGILAVTPYYNRPTPLGLVKHFEAVADATDLPAILYNVPSRTGVNLDEKSYCELADHPLIVGIKEASGSLSIAADILSKVGDRIHLYTGNDDLIVPSAALGGSGCISAVSNALPVEISCLCRLCEDGNYTAAAELQLSLIPFIRAAYKETNPIPIKHALYKMGFCQNEFRLPLCPPSEETARLVESALNAISE